jgi:type II secretory pathway pseudopilin PulG
MFVVILVGVLAMIATVAYRKWVRSSYIGEAQNMLGNIRTAEEAFRAENTGYLNVSATLTTLYPPGNPPGTHTADMATQWDSTTPGWAALNIYAGAPVRFGYAVIANNDLVTAPPAVVFNNGALVDLAAMKGQPWFIATAVCDLDDNAATPDTTLFAVSGTNIISVNNEGL